MKLIESYNNKLYKYMGKSLLSDEEYEAIERMEGGTK